MNPNELLFFIAFLGFIFGTLLLDLGVFSRKSHVVSFKEATIWSLTWVILAICFYFIIKSYGHYIHGIENFKDLEVVVAKYVDDVGNLGYYDATDPERSIQSYRDNMALEFITGWLLEYSLSVDNIFVIILIFGSFNVRESYYKKVLFWGILGAVVMRFTFIFLGAALIHEFGWILYIFGAFLIYSGIKMLVVDDDESIETDKHPIVKFTARFFSVFPRYVKDNFFVMKKGKLFVTPLFVVVLIVEFTDLLFAVDSVPAVFAVTIDPYVVFFSNIFAILGLRSMFFFLSNVMHLFHYLKTGLAFLLTFIGIKMIAHEWFKIIGFKNEYSLYIILAILTISVLASILFPQTKEKEAVSV